VGPETDEALAALGADIAIESSGSPPGLATCVRAVRRHGRVVVLGLLPPGDVAIPGNLVVTRELDLVGSFRFDAEILHVLAALVDGSLETAPVVTHVLPLDDAAAALSPFGPGAIAAARTTEGRCSRSGSGRRSGRR
jgi:L-idonate 5-dehydrogenase